MEDNLITCPKCGKKIVDGIPFCPFCGEKQQHSLNDDEIRKNPYDILQVSPDAEPEVVEAAYKSLARKYHPDSGTTSVSEERMREINWAHEILTDPQKLVEWKRKHGKKQSANPITKAPDPGSSYTAHKSVTGNETTSSSPDQSSSAPPNPSGSPIISNPEAFLGGKEILQVLGGFALLIIILIIIVFAANSTKTVVSPTRAVYLQPTKTATLRPIPSPTVTEIDCTLWSQVRTSDVGYRKCVYGRIVKIYSTDQYAQIVRFSNEAGTFLIWDRNYYYTDISADMCVAVIGIIQRDASSFFMDIYDADMYQYSGCP